MIGSFILVLGILLIAALGFDHWTWPQFGAMAALLLMFGLALVLIDRTARLREKQHRLEVLEQQQTKHESAEQMAALGLWALELKSSELQWSSGAFRILGRRGQKQEPTLADFMASIHPDDKRRWTQVHQRSIRRDKPAKIEYRYRPGPDKEIWLRSIAQLVRNDEGQPLRIEGTIQDVSGIRAMQRQIAASEAKFRDLTHMSSDWVWETDLDHKLSYLSDSADSMLGPWARHMIGNHRWERTTADPLPTNWSDLKARLNGRQPFENFEYSILDPDNNAYHLCISGRPVFDDKNQFTGYRGTGQNITRERQQRSLLEIDSDIAAILREQTDSATVITAVLESACKHMGFLGGVRLERQHQTASAKERSGTAAFSRMVIDLPVTMPIEDLTVEGQIWASGEPRWHTRLAGEIDFSRRYRVEELSAQAALIAPIQDKNGEVLSLLLFLGPVAFQGDEFLGQVAALLSRTLSLYMQRAQAEIELRHASLHDALTGLPNRVQVNQTLERLLSQKTPVALLYIDLDRYKIVNDTLGHSAGDRALVEVARRLKQAIPQDDVAGRMGGDEFIAILSDPPDKEGIATIGRRILQAIEQPLVLANRAYFLSASVGIALSPQDSDEVSSLIKAADAAMYEVKSEGRNDLRFFSGNLKSPAHLQQLQLAAELPIAMQRGEVELFYQPVLDAKTRQVECVEALLRWRHPRLGLLLPERFMAAAEQSNLMREIDFWVVRRAINDRIKIGLDRYESMGVSVNVSIRQLAEPDFLESLYGQLRDLDFPARLLRLELTENSFIENPEKTIEMITQLRQLGVRVVIDNFGTGYSSLSHIKDLPIDGLKIDSAFIRGLPDDRGNAAIVQAITTLAGKLGMQAMAEGVETPSEMRGLRELNCEVMQGELISAPVPFRELEGFLESLPSVRQMHLVGSKKNQS